MKPRKQQFLFSTILFNFYLHKNKKGKIQRFMSRQQLIKRWLLLVFVQFCFSQWRQQRVADAAVVVVAAFVTVVAFVAVAAVAVGD